MVNLFGICDLCIVAYRELEGVKLPPAHDTSVGTTGVPLFGSPRETGSPHQCNRRLALSNSAAEQVSEVNLALWKDARLKLFVPLFPML